MIGITKVLLCIVLLNVFFVFVFQLHVQLFAFVIMYMNQIILTSGWIVDVVFGPGKNINVGVHRKGYFFDGQKLRADI